jgi:parallel beta-helix repeat protein
VPGRTPTAGRGEEMRRVVLVAFAVFALLLAYAPPALAGPTFVVDNDRAECPNADFTSIQAAVTAAPPGSTILVCAGEYHEAVNIPSTKDDLRILAKGAPGDVVVDGDMVRDTFFLEGVSGVLIQGFTVREAREADILLLSASGNTIRKNVLTAAHHDGIELVASSFNLIEHNLSINNPAPNACGINLTNVLGGVVFGGSTNNVVRHNTSTNNEWGIQIAGPTSTGNLIFHNETIRNRGNGIRNIAGASGTMIENNRVFENGFTPSAFTGATNGGIRLGSGTGIVVARNHAFDNLLVDIRNEAGLGVTFENNHCNTSLPPSPPATICEHDEGEGH